jgi:hypothetical protein
MAASAIATITTVTRSNRSAKNRNTIALTSAASCAMP